MPTNVGAAVLIACWSMVAQLTPASGQSPARWLAHDMQRPRPPVVTPGKQSLPVQPPSDAIVVFDGSDLSKWRDAEGGPAKWRVQDGYMESVADSGYVFSAGKFGDVQLHVEWATPVPARRPRPGTRQQRRVSDGPVRSAGARLVRERNLPRRPGRGASTASIRRWSTRACRPGEWQSYDIVFRRPRFHGDGTVARPARITVFQNGVLVQDDVEIWGPTAWLQLHSLRAACRQAADFAARPRQPGALSQHLAARVGRSRRSPTAWPNRISDRWPAFARRTAKVRRRLRQHTRRDGQRSNWSDDHLQVHAKTGQVDRPRAPLGHRIRHAVHRRQARLQRERRARCRASRCTSAGARIQSDACRRQPSDASRGVSASLRDYQSVGRGSATLRIARHRYQRTGSAASGACPTCRQSGPVIGQPRA